MIIGIGCNAISQKIYFVYLQTEQDQPFFVRMNDTLYSYAASGYIILPKLYDSTYSFSVGFPQDRWPEQRFSVKIGGRDHGYLIKNFGEKGWGLFDLQTKAVQMSASEIKNGDNTSQTNVSRFTEILAKATGDSTLKQKPVETRTEEKKAMDVADKAAPIKPDSIAVAAGQTLETEPKTQIIQPAVQKEEKKTAAPVTFKKSMVTRKSESSTTSGFIITYIDDDGVGKDTIKITIPEPAIIAGKNVREKVASGKNDEIKFLDIDVKANQSQANTIVFKNRGDDSTEKKPVSMDTLIEKAASKDHCAVTADNKDFFELRKIMAASNGNDEMVQAAKKYFKTKCFLTEQIKNLSTLFLDDAGKYNFFDTAYGHVSDKENFDSLQSELKDPVYINRFKEILRK